MSKLVRQERAKIGAASGGKMRRVPRDKVAPVFDTMFDPVEGISVYGLPDTGDPEQNIDQEISHALSAVLDERRKRREQFRIQLDAGFYFTVSFQTSEQKREFLERAGWLDLGALHLDGFEVAQRMGIDIEPILLARPATTRTPVKLRETELITIPES